MSGLEDSGSTYPVHWVPRERKFLNPEEQEAVSGWCPKEEAKKRKQQGMRILGPPECAKCERETVPLGLEDYPRRCPICGTRWHQVLPWEQDLLSRSNLEFWKE